MTNSSEDFHPTFQDTERAFDKAIQDKVLLIHPKDDNYAGNYMYMYTHEGKNWFKNINSRSYLTSQV